MRRHLVTSTAALAAAIASFGPATAAFAGGPVSASGHTVATAPRTQTAPPSNSTAAPKGTPAPSAVKATASLYLPDAFFVRGNALTVPGRLVHVRGVVRPYVAGQVVAVKEFLGRRAIGTDRLRVKPAPGGRSGVFTAKLRSPGAGLVTIKVSHARTSQMQGFVVLRRIAALSPHAGFGSRGKFVALIQQRLAALHIFVIQSGVYDSHTGLALDAYHRLLGHGTSQSLDRATVSELLNGVGSFRLHNPRDGVHAEGNLGKQLLALAKGSQVAWIFPISSGKPSTPTILGHFHVYSRVPGYLPDGMYYSNFFYGGYAIHGYDPAPNYPASHGCMRLPISDAIFVFHWLNYGDAVDVYH
jgi:L,D-transpeptidase catalytic domain